LKEVVVLSKTPIGVQSW